MNKPNPNPRAVHDTSCLYRSKRLRKFDVSRFFGWTQFSKMVATVFPKEVQEEIGIKLVKGDTRKTFTTPESTAIRAYLEKHYGNPQIIEENGKD